MTQKTSRARRVLRYWILQKRVLAQSVAGSIHLAMLIGFLGLFSGALLVVTDDYVLEPYGIVLLSGPANVVLQGLLDVLGIVLFAGLVAAFARRAARGSRVPRSKEILALVAVMGLLVVTGFLVEGFRMSLDPDHGERLCIVGRPVAWLVERLGLSHPACESTYRILFWGHIGLAVTFLMAAPFTYLIHPVTTLLHIWSSSSRPRAELSTPFVLKDVIEKGEFDIQVGAEKIGDFDGPLRTGIAACVSCGRCQDVCPADASGTALSPTRLMHELGLAAAGRGAASASLFDDAVSDDEVWACHLCGACSESCPVLVHPPDYVIELRRGLVARRQTPKKATEVLANLGSTLNAYGLPPARRENLAQELGVSTLSENPDVEYLYWVGCAGTFDARVRKVVEATFRILKAAGVSFGILGAEERCNGDLARRLGEEGRFQELVLQNLETLERYQVKKIITHCAHCFNVFKNEYPRFGGSFETYHHAEFLRGLLGKLQIQSPASSRVTLHDSCYVGRFNRELAAPREVLRALGDLELVEMPRNGKSSFCCGGGGGQYWHDVPRREKVSTLRVREARGTAAETLVVECPFCLRMLEDASNLEEDAARMPVKDIAEVLAEALVQD